MSVSYWISRCQTQFAISVFDTELRIRQPEGFHSISFNDACYLYGSKVKAAGIAKPIPFAMLSTRITNGLRYRGMITRLAVDQRVSVKYAPGGLVEYANEKELKESLGI